MRQAIERMLFGRKALQPFYQRLFNFALAGMHYNRGWDVATSGELQSFNLLKARTDSKAVVFDVGASIGDYSEAVLSAFNEKVSLYSFEPSQVAFNRLSGRLRKYPNACLYKLGVSDHSGEALLYADEYGSPIGSLHSRHFSKADYSESILLTTLDQFTCENKIQTIDLLKIDVEGHEFAVLKGAQRLIKANAIGIIQFEISSGTIDSRAYFKDFYEILNPDFDINRIVSDGLIPIYKYTEKSEIFQTMNFLAINRNWASRSV